MRASYLTNKASGAGSRRNAIRLPGADRVCGLGRCALAIVLIGAGCAPADPAETERSLRVNASAYNSTRAQTNENPTLAAWGDTLEPGMRSIAVSRDLIPLGLHHGVAVRIEGLEGEYVVRDKMAARWEKKIDIYMGNDVAAAREWGTRELTIYWPAEEPAAE